MRVEAPAEAVWPWVAQVRPAPYSYDWIDNLGRRSPRELAGLPEPRIGERFTMAGEREVGRILSVDRGKHLTGTIMGAFMSYVLVPENHRATRLLLKVVMQTARWKALALCVGDLIMARRQLLNLKQLAERHPHQGMAAECAGSVTANSKAAGHPHDPWPQATIASRVTLGSTARGMSTSGCSRLSPPDSWQCTPGGGSGSGPLARRGTATLVMANCTSRFAKVPRSRPLSRDRTRCPRCPADAECARLVALGAVRVRLLPADGDNESCLVIGNVIETICFSVRPRGESIHVADGLRIRQPSLVIGMIDTERRGA